MPFARTPARLFASLTAAMFASAAPADTIFVNVALASGANNGTSWSDAYQGVTGRSGRAHV